MTLLTLAAIGFGAAALAYLALGILLVVRGAPTSTGRLFVGAVAVEAAWAATLAGAMSGQRVPLFAVAAVEAARLFLWVVFLLSLLRLNAGALGPGAAAAGPDGVHPAQRAANMGVVAAATIAAGLLAVEIFAFGERPAFVVNVVGAVFGLVCMEQTYRNTPAASRWALKFLAIALLAIFGFDLVMYSEALLFSRLNPALWTARGYAHALMVPMLAVAAARNQHWRLDIAVSRDVVFHSATLFGAGLYLILMATAGYYVRWFGGDWGAVAQALILFVGLVALLVFVLSGRMRSRLRVFLAKNFFRYRYDYRAEWLRLTQLLAGRPGAEQAPLEVRALEGLGALVDSRGGALWLAGDGGEFSCTARWHFNGPTPVIPASEPLIAFLRERQWVVDMAEWRAEPDVYEDLRLPAALTGGADTWLIVPLILHEALVGLVVLSRAATPAEVNWEVRDALKAAARQVASYLGERRAVEALVQARQFESFNRMSAFVVHDLKNLVAQLSLLLANAAKHRNNPAFQQDMLETVENVLGRMQGLLMQLRAGAKPIEPAGAVPAAEALAGALRGKGLMRPAPELQIAADVRDVAVRAHRDRLERVIGHLVQNAVEATPGDGKVWVRLRREGALALIEIEDTGKGMSEAFIRERLFKPFQSTKEHGMGIGSFESREYVRELGGAMEVDSREGRGTTFRIRLPLATVEAAA